MASQDFQVFIEDQYFDVNMHEAQNLDLVPITGNNFHLISDHRSHHIEIMSSAENGCRITIKLNGQRYSCQIKTPIEVSIANLKLNTSGSKKPIHLKAPMPGLVIDVKVGVGQSINRGDPLLILEAMKMENLIKASSAGTIGDIKVSQGDSVEKGQILIEMK